MLTALLATRSYTMGSPTRLYRKSSSFVKFVSRMNLRCTELLYPEAGMLRAPARLSDDSMNVDVAPAPKEPLNGPVAEWSAYLGYVSSSPLFISSISKHSTAQSSRLLPSKTPWMILLDSTNFWRKRKTPRGIKSLSQTSQHTAS